MKAQIILTDLFYQTKTGWETGGDNFVASGVNATYSPAPIEMWEASFLFLAHLVPFKIYQE